MRKFIALMIGAIFLMGAVAVINAADVNKGAATYTIDKCQKRKSPVEFNHAKHQGLKGVTCKTCHHKVKEGETPRACFQCHKCKRQGEIPSAMMAFHKRCRGCHAKLKKEGKPAGPTKCSGCHPRKK